MERDVLINPNRKRTYEKFLREALAHYKALSHENKWNHPGQDGAVFNADGTKKYHQDRNTGRNDGPSPYCAPTQADKVKNDPECFRRQIKGKEMEHCAKCTRFKNSDKKGRWNTSHYTHEHTGRHAGSTNNDNDAGTPTRANLADASTASTTNTDEHQ